MNAEALLGRPERAYPLPDLSGRRVIVTGNKGSLGRLLTPTIDALGGDVVGFDLPTLDVTRRSTAKAIKDYKPDLIFHLAADKHAPAGEQHPYSTQHVNIEGTARVLAGAPRSCRVIVGSTCKACDPETVYGASKLVAERMTLGYRQTVGRLYNVIESHDNVFALWTDQLETQGYLLVTPCSRYFISIREAIAFLLSLSDEEPGRYSPYPGNPVSMLSMAHRFLAMKGFDAEAADIIQAAPPRRGDRLTEPLWSSAELGVMDPAGRVRVTNEHDLGAQRAMELVS